MECGRVVSFDRIVEQLWADSPPPSVRSTVYANLSRLRAALRPTGLGIENRPPGYVLVAPREVVDAHAFVDVLERCEELAAHEDWEEVVAATDLARALWDGPPFEGAVVLDDLGNERRRLERLAERVEELSTQALLELERPGEATRRAEGLVARDAFNESYWRLRMRAEHADGRTAAALSTYREFRDLLNDQLGIDPSEQLRSLHLSILRDADAGDDDPTPTAPTTGGASPTTTRPRPWGVEPPAARSRERQVIDTALAEALTRGGRVLLLEGEPGIGKTRLAEYAADSARQAGATVTWSRAVAGAGTPALWLWETVVRDLCGPEAARRLMQASPDLPAEEAQFRVYEQIAAAVLAASDERPVAVVLDDLQWADDGTLRTLLLLAENLRGRRCLVVATTRPRDPGSADAAARLPALPANSLVTRLWVEPLAVADVEQLVTSWSGPLDADVDDAAALHRRTGGNPYLLVEILRDGGTTRVPATVAEIFDRRLASLSDAVRAVAEHLAVAGRRIDPVLIARARGTTVAEVVALLEPLRAEGIVVSDQATRSLAFAHDLGREAVSQRIPPSHRLAIHSRLADAIAEVYADDLDPHLEALADHRYQAAAGAPSLLAYEACMAAADQASTRHAYDGAAVHRTRALEMLVPGTEHRDIRFEVLLELATELRLSGDVVAAASSLTQAVAVARALGDRVLLRRSLSLLGEVTVWNWRQLGEVDEQTVTLLDDLLDHDLTASRSHRMPDAERARILGTLAVELYYGDERERSLSLATQGVETARRLDDPELEGRVLNNFVIASWFPEAATARRRALDDSLADPRRPQVTEAVARLHRAPLRLEEGDVHGFLEDLARAEWLAPRVGRPELTAQVASQWMGYHGLRGDLDAAQESMQETDRILTRMSLWGGDWVRTVGQVAMARVSGTLSEVTGSLVDQARSDATNALRWTAALAVALDGDVAGARRLQGQWGLTTLPRRSHWGSAFEWAQAAELALLTGAPGLEETDERLARLSSPLVVVGTALAVWGPVDRLRARLAAERGREQDARRHHRAAEAVTQRVRDQLGVDPVWALASV